MGSSTSYIIILLKMFIFQIKHEDALPPTFTNKKNEQAFDKDLS